MECALVACRSSFWYFSAARIPSILSELQDMSELYERRVMVILPIRMWNTVMLKPGIRWAWIKGRDKVSCLTAVSLRLAWRSGARHLVRITPKIILSPRLHHAIQSLHNHCLIRSRQSIQSGNRASPHPITCSWCVTESHPLQLHPTPPSRHFACSNHGGHVWFVLLSRRPRSPYSDYYAIQWRRSRYTRS